MVAPGARGHSPPAPWGRAQRPREAKRCKAWIPPTPRLIKPLPADTYPPPWGQTHWGRLMSKGSRLRSQGSHTAQGRKCEKGGDPLTAVMATAVTTEPQGISEAI